MIRAALLSLAVGLVSAVGAAVWEPRPGLRALDVPVAGGPIVAGDLLLRLTDAELLELDETRMRVRALGPEPRIEVRWRGSGAYERRVEVVLENVNLDAGVLSVSPLCRETARRGATVTLEAPLRDGPLEASIAIPPATAARGRFAVFGCSRSNRLIEPILADIARERPLFVVHLGDLGHGLAYECEALRAALDGMGLPLFVAPGNHDVAPVPAYSLKSFHRAFNPAPVAFDVADQRVAILDVADFPIAPAQLDWLEEEVAAAGARRVSVFLHRSPIDPEDRGRELEPEQGAARLEEVLARAKDARTYAGHLHGCWTGTFGGHPFVLSSGGGEDKHDGRACYHHLLVPLDGAPPEVVRYEAPTALASALSRAWIEGPVLLGRWRVGLGAAAIAGLLLARLARRAPSSRGAREARPRRTRFRLRRPAWRRYGSGGFTFLGLGRAR